MLSREVARRAGEEFHLHDVLRELGAGALSTRTTDVLEAIGGRVHDRHSVEVPLGALAKRDLTAGSGAAGGYLVAADVGAAAAALRPVSCVVAAGAQVIPDLEGNVTIPRVSASATAYWLATEATTVTPSQLTLAQLSLSPKNGGVYTAFSRQLSLQTPNLARVLEADMRTVVGRLIDAAAVSGPGSGGAPTGILSVGGIGSQSGSNLAWAGIQAMRKAARVAGGLEGTTAWIAAPDVVETLAKRERAAGSGFIIDAMTCDGRPVYSSPTVAAGTLLLADWSVVALGFWGGITFEVNPYQAFSSGGMSARILVSMDVNVTQPAAVVAATSVT